MSGDLTLCILDAADSYHSSDEDEDGEEEEEEGEQQPPKEGEVKSEVKTEPGTSKKKPKDSDELHIYLDEELKLFKPNQLSADVQLLDGTCSRL